MQLFAKFKKILRRGFRATLNFRKFKVALNHLRRFFLNFAKRCTFSCWLQFNNKKWRSPSSILSYKRLKLNLRVFLAGHIVAMVTYCVTKILPTCSPMTGQVFDTMIVASIALCTITKNRFRHMMIPWDPPHRLRETLRSATKKCMSAECGPEEKKRKT